jgi:hypothetical protein
MRGFMMCGVALATLAATAFGQGFGGEQSTTTTNTTTTKSQSGDTTTTTTTTRTQTNSGGFSLFGPPPGPGGPSYETVGGSWQIGEANGNKVCELTLEPKKFISSYSARTGIGCPEGLFGVSSWLLAGDEIRLMSPGGSVLAKLRPAGHGRWNGSTTAGLAIFMTRQ